MRISLLSLLVALTFFACNRDATSRTNGTFPAPASAPTKTTAVKSFDNEDAPRMAPAADIDISDEYAKEAPAPMTDEQQEASKRLGPAKGAGMTPATVMAKPVTANAGMVKQPAPKPASDMTDKPALDYGRAIVTIAKSACHSGDRCRQFTISLTADRRLILEPKWNMDLKGTHVRQLTATEYGELTAAMEATEPANLNTSYPTDHSNFPVDLQSTSLTYADVYGAPKRVNLYQEGPEEVIEFMALMEAWIDKDGWARMVP
jgi:hypothetical protein